MTDEDRDIQQRGAAARVGRMRLELTWSVVIATIVEHLIRAGLAIGHAPGLSLLLFTLLGVGVHYGLKRAILSADLTRFAWRLRSPWRPIFWPLAAALAVFLQLRIF